MAETGTDIGMMVDGDSQALSDWTLANDRGLALAADGAWSEAASAFQSAVDALAQDLPLRPATHEPLALVLGNLAHACFKAGRLDDALQHAQRTCALRVAIAGEDGMPVARARMDLAVMLASCDRGEEAMALVQRAIAAIEHRVGDEDARLAIVLENAARIALALGSPSNAEPLLLRLHALLHAHDLSTGRADKLLAKVADVRASQRLTPPTSAPRVPTPTNGAMLQRVAETIERRRLTLDDLEPLEAPVEAPLDAPMDAPMQEPMDAPAANAMPSASPSLTLAFETPGSSDALDVREYAHATIDTHAPWEEEPVIERPPIAEPVLAARPATVAPVFRDLNRGPTIAMPTPDRGMRTVETPSRAQRAVGRDAPPARRAPDEDTAATRSAPTEPAEAKSGVYLPMIVGTAITVGAGAGAVWWFILR